MKGEFNLYASFLVMDFQKQHNIPFFLTTGFVRPFDPLQVLSRLKYDLRSAYLGYSAFLCFYLFE